MSYQNWLNYLESAEKIGHYAFGDRKRIVYKFPDGRVMLEEYSVSPCVLIKRCWQRKDLYDITWDYEVGTPAKPELPNNVSVDEVFMREVVPLPEVTKRSTKRNFEWRITDMKYPLEIYNVQADTEKNTIVVRTTNKKYFKILEVPDLKRCELPIEPERLSFRLQQNTLIITYAKPELIKELEQTVQERINTVWLRSELQRVANNLIKKL